MAKIVKRKPRVAKPDPVNWKQPFPDSTGCMVRVSLDGTFRLVQQDQCDGVRMPLRWVLWQERKGMQRKVFEGRSEKKALEFAARRAAQLDDQEED